MRLGTILARSLRLRCPRCGRGRLFEGWFRMARGCPECGLKFDREPGYFLGSIYFNYGVTAVIVTASYVVGSFVYQVPDNVLLAVLGTFCFLFPLWFFRYARALWMGLDELFDARGTPPKTP